jgi:pimeloyl-ACP methyl ester carboxylesterase
MVHSGFSQSAKRTFVLVHAQWHGAWCWNKVVPLLQGSGNTAISFDMPGFGEDPTPAEEVSFEECVEKVVREAWAQPGLVWLVGHSSSGLVIAQAAERLGKEKVEGLVFLDAFLPADGESVFSLSEKFAGSAGPPLQKALIVSTDQKTIALNPAMVRELLYADCTEEDFQYALERLRPGPLSVLATPVQLTQQNYGSIPKYYILCTKAKDMDKSTLATNVSCREIIELPASHSPFFSMPDKLVEILNRLGR